MKPIRLVMAVVNPTATAHPALVKAGLIAATNGARLRLFCCDRDPRLVTRLLLDPAALSAARAAFLSRRRDWLAGLAEPWSRQGLAVEIEAAWDAPLHSGILREVALARPDLVVKDSLWHKPLRLALFTSTDWFLVQGCATPLLLAKAAPWAARPRILAAVDPDHPDDPADVLDHAILSTAERLVTAINGELAVVHAYPDAAAREGAEQAVAALLQGHRCPQSAVRLVAGDPLDVLPAACLEVAADLLAVGVQSRSRLYERVIGSTAERLLDRIPCDLLVVHPPALA